MRKKIKSGQIITIVILIMVYFTLPGCSEKNPVTAPAQETTGISTLAKHGLDVNFRQFNLVTDTIFHGARLDPNLSNAWGIAVSPTGIFWISANHTGVATVYDAAGNQKLNPVTIPTSNNAPGGAPSGAVFNFTTAFKLAGGAASRFIFVGEDGIVSAWGQSAGSSAVVVADQSAQNAVYKGVEIAQNGSKYFLYAANFRLAKVDVFDENFSFVNSISFIDPNIPAGYAPFNIKNINGMLFVTYAKQKLPEKMDDDKGLGHGFVDIFTPAGVFVTRFTSQGSLNSPWGIAEGPAGKLANTILIGNFGDGRINIFKTSGEFMGQVKGNEERPIAISGLWAIFTSNSIPGVGNKIYFTAGPNGEDNGLFGYLLSKEKNEGHEGEVSDR